MNHTQQPAGNPVVNGVVTKPTASPAPGGRRLMAGHEALNLICDALGIDRGSTMQKMVIEIEAGGIPKVYLTHVVRADDVLRVVETLKGAKVEAATDGSVEVVPLVLGGQG